MLARFASALKQTYREELERMRAAPHNARALRSVEPLLYRDEKMLGAPVHARLAETLAKSSALSTMMSMRRDLVALWSRSAATREQLIRQLQDWCRRAAATGIRSLAEFSTLLRRYA